MHYEHHPDNIFAHRVVLAYLDDQSIVEDIFSGLAKSRVAAWLRTSVGDGSYNYHASNEWHAYGGILRSLGLRGGTIATRQAWVGFRDHGNATLFQVAWTGMNIAKQA